MSRFAGVDPIHPKYGDKHECPACGRSTKRRIRVYPTFGTEDARCDKCVRTNKWPEQEKGVKYGDASAHQAPETDPDQASLV